MDRIISSLRVAAAAVVGWFLTLVATHFGIGIDEATEANLVAAVQLILTVMYYIGVRAVDLHLPDLVESITGGRIPARRVRRWIGFLLVVPTLPIQVSPDDEPRAIQALRNHNLHK